MTTPIYSMDSVQKALGIIVDLEVKEVSLVDHPANGWSFLIRKNANSQAPKTPFHRVLTGIIRKLELTADMFEAGIDPGAVESVLAQAVDLTKRLSVATQAVGDGEKFETIMSAPVENESDKVLATILEKLEKQSTTLTELQAKIVEQAKPAPVVVEDPIPVSNIETSAPPQHKMFIPTAIPVRRVAPRW